MAKLGLPPALRRFFATTNCIENLIGTLRRVTRNIKRWRDGDMRRRWIGLGLLRIGSGAKFNSERDNPGFDGRRGHRVPASCQCTLFAFRPPASKISAKGT